MAVMLLYVGCAVDVLSAFLFRISECIKSDEPTVSFCAGCFGLFGNKAANKLLVLKIFSFMMIVFV